MWSVSYFNRWNKIEQIGELTTVWFPKPAVSLWDPEDLETYLLEIANERQMHFSSVVLKRMLLKAKVTHQVHSNLTEISSCWAAAVWHRPGPRLTLLHRWTLICRPCETCLRLIHAGFQNRADERKRDKDASLSTRNQRGCLSVTGSLNRFKGWSNCRFEFRNIKNDIKSNIPFIYYVLTAFLSSFE